jgi:HAE1 family hydrophobic/amphiphilic exporter-1
VIDGVEDDKTMAWFNGTRGVILAISRQPGTNTVEIVDAIHALLPELRGALPPPVFLGVALVATEYKRGSHLVVFLNLGVCN